MADAILEAPLAQTELGPGMRIVLEAIDPVTGSSIGGVVVSDIAVEADLPGLGRASLEDLGRDKLTWYPIPLTS